MPIVKKEIDALKRSLDEIRIELEKKFNIEMQFAEYQPKPYSLFEHFVLYNSALAVSPERLQLNRLSRGDARSAGGLPIPAVKSYKTVWRMGTTLKPSITVACKNELSFWFDRALVNNLRPDIVVRPGHFEIEGEISEHVQLLRNGSLIAEYCCTPLEQQDGFLMLSQTMKWSSGETARLYFRAKNEYLHPPLIIECKSFGAKLGNPEEYATHAEAVVIVSPEKLYQPKRENMHVIRVDREFSNLQLRKDLLAHLEHTLT